MRHFRKVVLSTAIKINGKAIPWEKITVNSGVRAFNEETDGAIIAELDRRVDKHTDGVTRISPEMYENLKKNRTSTTSPPQPTALERVRIANREASLVSPLKKSPVTAESVAPPVNAAAPPPEQHEPFAKSFNPIGGPKARAPIGGAVATKKFVPRTGKLSKVEKPAPPEAVT